MIGKTLQNCACGGKMEWRDYCGANVCNECGFHEGLARCFCGWAASGGNGREELINMGEVIDDEY